MATTILNTHGLNSDDDSYFVIIAECDVYRVTINNDNIVMKSVLNDKKEPILIHMDQLAPVYISCIEDFLIFVSKSLAKIEQSENCSIYPVIHFNGNDEFIDGIGKIKKLGFKTVVKIFSDDPL